MLGLVLFAVSLEPRCLMTNTHEFPEGKNSAFFGLLFPSLQYAALFGELGRIELFYLFSAFPGCQHSLYGCELFCLLPQKNRGTFSHSSPFSSTPQGYLWQEITPKVLPSEVGKGSFGPRLPQPTLCRIKVPVWFSTHG